MRTFRGRPQELRLPTRAAAADRGDDREPNRPQPRLDADLGGGMTVTRRPRARVPGAARKFVALGHNTIRGAAGAAILNAELMHAEGMLLVT